jgi:hypothetical protein
VDIRDDENVTVLGDPLLMRRATPSARAHESVDVELLFMEQRRRLVNLATAITLDRSVAEELCRTLSPDCSTDPATCPTLSATCTGPS